MPKPQPIELEALEQAGALLRFAAENKDVPKDVVSTIALSWEARDTDSWTPEISAKFWGAYNALCSTIKPVSIDTLSCNEQKVAPARRWFGRTSTVMPSLPKKVARNYLNILIGFLLVAIVLQFIVSTAGNLASEIDTLVTESDKISDNINQEIVNVRSSVKSGNFSDQPLTPQQSQAIVAMQNDFEKLWYNEEKIATKIILLGYISSFNMIDTSWDSGNLNQPKSVDESEEELIRYYNNRIYFISTEEKGALIIRILSTTILPLVFGIVGACAYVTRLISDQIRETTFSSTSPIRHLVRVALGALAGVVVGFGWIGAGISSSPLALAFIAGYAVEPVFATVDGIAEKFRKSP